MKKTVLFFTAILIALLLILDISLFIQGSLEEIPTSEQIEKGRIVYGLMSIPLIVIEVFVLRKLYAKNKKDR